MSYSRVVKASIELGHFLPSRTFWKEDQTQQKGLVLQCHGSLIPTYQAHFLAKYLDSLGRKSTEYIQSQPDALPNSIALFSKLVFISESAPVTPIFFCMF